MGKIGDKIRNYIKKRFNKRLEEPTLVDYIEDKKGTKKEIKNTFKKGIDKIFG